MWNLNLILSQLTIFFEDTWIKVTYQSLVETKF